MVSHLVEQGLELKSNDVVKLVVDSNAEGELKFGPKPEEGAKDNRLRAYIETILPYATGEAPPNVAVTPTDFGAIEGFDPSPWESTEISRFRRLEFRVGLSEAINRLGPRPIEVGLELPVPETPAPPRAGITIDGLVHFHRQGFLK